MASRADRVETWHKSSSGKGQIPGRDAHRRALILESLTQRSSYDREHRARQQRKAWMRHLEDANAIYQKRGYLGSIYDDTEKSMTTASTRGRGTSAPPGTILRRHQRRRRATSTRVGRSRTPSSTGRTASVRGGRGAGTRRCRTITIPTMTQAEARVMRIPLYDASQNEVFPFPFCEAPGFDGAVCGDPRY